MIVEDDPYFCVQHQSGQADNQIGNLYPSYLSLDADNRVIRLDTFSKVLLIPLIPSHPIPFNDHIAAANAHDSYDRDVCLKNHLPHKCVEVHFSLNYWQQEQETFLIQNFRCWMRVQGENCCNILFPELWSIRCSWAAACIDECWRS